jgi:shikimate kinase
MTKIYKPESQPVMLIGFMGTGKSTIGEAVAGLMGFDFIDIDREIEYECTQTIPEIFSHHGEKYFREIESSVLAKVCNQPETIIACGGGIVIRQENRKIIERSAFVIWLRCPVALCIKRCDNGNRPLLNKFNALSSAKKLFMEREPYYKQVADMEVFTNGINKDDIAESIALNLKNAEIK